MSRDKVWQVVPADPSALHTHGGCEMTCDYVCKQLTEMDGFMRASVPKEVFQGYEMRMHAIMELMVVTGEDSVKPKRVS